MAAQSTATSENEGCRPGGPGVDAAGSADPREEEGYESNETQIYLTASDLLFYYQIKGDVMNLHHRKANVWVRLKREPGP